MTSRRIITIIACLLLSALMFLLNTFGFIDNNNFVGYIVDANIEGCNSPKLEQLFSDVYIGTTKICKVDDSKAGMTISFGENNIPSEYKQYKAGYSPIIALFPTEVSKDSSTAKKNFMTRENDAYNSSLFDMKQLLTAVMESEDGTFNLAQVGCSKNVVGIKLAIPAKQNSDRKYVVDSIIYSLTDGEDVTPQNADSIKRDLTNILGKAVNETNCYDQVSRDYRSENSEKTVLLIPEYYTAGVYRSCKPIYFSGCSVVPITVASKNKEISVDRTDDKFYPSEYADILNSNNKVMECIGLRNDTIQDIDGGNVTSGYEIDKIDIRVSQDNLEELLGTNYWK